MRDDLPEQLITAFQSADTPSTNLRPEICAKIVGLLSNPETYKQVLSRRNLSAQHLLDFLQDLLDDPSSFSAKPPLVRVLLRLSRVSGRHPRCLTVADLKKEGMQVAAGNFSDLWKGSFRGKDVSIKVMRLFETSDIQVLLQEFSREALIWRQLSHPNLLPFYGLYFLDRRLCLISPWMQNGNVLAYLNNKPAHINPLSLILDVALGLEYLHKNNVVHGDLKAINILVTPSHRACIADFGLSSITNPMTLRFTHTTVERGQGGTPRYQAPELFQDDTRHHFGSDVYAFACVCYEARKIPFHEISNDMNVMLKVRDGKRPSRPFSWAGTPSVLDELWQLLQDCWNGTSELRPKANEIVERLISPPLQARTSQDTSDWDDASTSKARRALQPPPPAMTLAQLDMLISGEWCYGPCNECER
ncbi:kinase-like domain-containing protein [Mycena metata]|uniref:Kinase-like domain-containing protein n=1 Tax=Mycena metata TaxID=1033252 RepID=A0AAD7HF18_9AGAR|nr:kinase-like domain-containing protein [Mycena metata]